MSPYGVFTVSSSPMEQSSVTDIDGNDRKCGGRVARDASDQRRRQCRESQFPHSGDLGVKLERTGERNRGGAKRGDVAGRGRGEGSHQGKEKR